MRIGIDFGGTKTAAIALAADGAVLAYKRVATPRPHDYTRALNMLVELVAAIETQTGQRGTVGVGTPGSISPATGLLRNANSTYLNGRPLDRDIAQALGRPIRMANDADCFALSEAKDGAAAGAKSVLGVILGTGTGTGIVIHGKLLTGPNAVTGEWGHNPLPAPRDDERPGPECYCGRRGCVETFLSGPGMLALHQAAGGEAATATAIFEQAATQSLAAQARDDYIDRLARTLAVTINIVDPEAIVLGGGISNIDMLYERVPRVWGRYVFSDSVATRLLKNRHGDDSGVRGAANLY